MSPLAEARRVQEEHFLCDDGLTRWCRQCGQAFPCLPRRLADEVCRLSELAEKVFGIPPPEMDDDTEWGIFEFTVGDVRAFAPPAKGGEGG